MAVTQARNARLELRLSEDVKTLLQQAADALGKKLSEFVVDSARHEAVDVIADRRVFLLDRKKMAEFERRLNQPVQEHPKLKKLMRSNTVFE